MTQFEVTITDTHKVQVEAEDKRDAIELANTPTVRITWASYGRTFKAREA